MNVNLLQKVNQLDFLTYFYQQFVFDHRQPLRKNLHNRLRANESELSAVPVAKNKWIKNMVSLDATQP